MTLKTTCNLLQGFVPKLFLLWNRVAWFTPYHAAIRKVQNGFYLLASSELWDAYILFDVAS